MSRFRLQPTPAQERVSLEHCGHARFVWNLAVEQHAHWSPGRRAGPGFACDADVNAAVNVLFAAGHAVTARGGPPLGGPENREPQRDLLLVR
ncbi:helix-turn-helix domain-containing protein [Actinokineospora sp.]|uniref:helix-turn-helix domain-containing protein n=1 Tax=Actinokineospora sp. TaxID=1872133 RepID=UPI003D6B3612